MNQLKIIKNLKNYITSLRQSLEQRNLRQYLKRRSKEFDYKREPKNLDRFKLRLPRRKKLSRIEDFIKASRYGEIAELAVSEADEAFPVGYFGEQEASVRMYRDWILTLLFKNLSIEYGEVRRQTKSGDDTRTDDSIKGDKRTVQREGTRRGRSGTANLSKQ